MMYFLEDIEDHPNIADPLLTESWLRSWRAFMARNGKFIGIENNNETMFVKNLKRVSIMLTIRTQRIKE